MKSMLKNIFLAFTYSIAVVISAMLYTFLAGGNLYNFILTIPVVAAGIVGLYLAFWACWDHHSKEDILYLLMLVSWFLMPIIINVASKVFSKPFSERLYEVRYVSWFVFPIVLMIFWMISDIVVHYIGNRNHKSLNSQ